MYDSRRRAQVYFKVTVHAPPDNAPPLTRFMTISMGPRSHLRSLSENFFMVVPQSPYWRPPAIMEIGKVHGGSPRDATTENRQDHAIAASARCISCRDPKILPWLANKLAV